MPLRAASRASRRSSLPLELFSCDVCERSSEYETVIVIAIIAITRMIAMPLRRPRSRRERTATPTLADARGAAESFGGGELRRVEFMALVRKAFVTSC